MFKRWMPPIPANCLLLGPRRSGKTTLLRQRYPEYHYVTLDDLDYLDWARRDPKGFVESLPQNAIVDEVQRAPQITIALKKRIDEDSIRILMTGSSSLGLLDSTADTLAGRIQIRHLPTMCWGEDLGDPTHSIFGDELSTADLRAASRSLDLAVEYGGFPEVVLAKAAEQKLEILRNYRDTYFTRDLAQLSNIENIEGILAILQNTGRSLGSPLEISHFAREAGLSHPTAKKYVNILLQSDLAFKLYGYHLGTAKRYISSAKLYFCDAGLPTALRSRLTLGQLLENFIISELEKRRKLGLFNVDQLFYYRTVSGLEIDLVCEEDRSLVLAEIKASKSISRRDVANLKEYVKANPTKLIEPYLFYFGLEYVEMEGIKCIPVAALFRGR